MPFSFYSFGLFAALTAFVRALPTTPSPPSLDDLSSTGSSEVPEIPEIPGLPCKAPGNSDSESSSGSSFMGVGFSNTIDLGNLEELPTISTDFLAGSIQNYSTEGEDTDSDEEEE
ncbi:hypothetical protein BJX63DRAFT_375610 [Aspergillus granulosus]|uniref:Uncharacterized protein n=1 Tax=Aspergillus granulosus TaxID=176169 RepID=A0ABR4I508_9EURO